MSLRLDSLFLFIEECVSYGLHDILRIESGNGVVSASFVDTAHDESIK